MQSERELIRGQIQHTEIDFSFPPFHIVAKYKMSEQCFINNLNQRIDELQEENDELKEERDELLEQRKQWNKKRA